MSGSSAEPAVGSLPVPAPRTRIVAISADNGPVEYENVTIRTAGEPATDALNNLERSNASKPTVSKAIALPKPAPRSAFDAAALLDRQQQQDIYESNEHAPDEAASPLPVKQSPAVAAAVQKSADALPTKTPRRSKQRNSPVVVTNVSPTHAQTGTSSGVVVDAADASSPPYLQRSSRLNRSNVSLNSTASSGGSSVKEMTGDVLKAIGQRTTHKLDKLQTFSMDKLSESKSRLFSLTSTLQHKSLDRLHKARLAIGQKIIGNNASSMAVGKADVEQSPFGRQSGAMVSASSGSYDFGERPTTEPVGSPLLQIAFDSPMGERSGRYRNLSEQSYDAPRNAGGTLPPSYEQVFPRDNGGYGRLRATPETPAAKAESADSVYTEMSPVRPSPKAAGKRSDYEETEIRFKPKTLDCSSTRATIDSMDASDPARSTVDSLNLQSAAAVAEQQLPSPDRSESWRYYDPTAVVGGAEDEDDDEDDDDDDEPTYINVHDGAPVSVEMRMSDDDEEVEEAEPTYGSVFAVGRSAEPMPPTHFTPPNTLSHPVAKQPTTTSPKQQPTKPVRQPTHSADDLLREFDPLIADRSNANRPPVSDDSNEQLLVDAHFAGDKPLVQVASAAEAAAAPLQFVMNARPLDNEEALVEPFLAQVEKPSKSKSTKPAGDAQKTNWYVHGDAAAAPAAIDTSVMNFKSFEPPPPYSEKAAGVDQTPFADDETPTPPLSGASMSSRSRFPWFGKAKSQDVANANATGDDSAAAAAAAGESPVLTLCARPALPQALHKHDGHVVRLPRKAQSDDGAALQQPNAFIADGRFQVFDDGKNPKDSIQLQHIKSVQCVDQCGTEHNALGMHCFEIVVLTPSSRSAERLNRAMAQNGRAEAQPMKLGSVKFARSKFVYGALNEADRDVWLQKLLVSLTDRMPSKAACRYYRAGWCYMRLSVTGRWSSAWCVLQKHKKLLYCYTTEGMNVDVLDLRKARCMTLIADGQSSDGGSRVFGESGPMIMLDCPPYAVYIMMATAKETKIWHDIIREVAHHNGPLLSEQQLTANDVPVIVQKCVDFIDAYGSLSEGIYRHSASNQAVKALLQEFRHDAFQVQLTHGRYTEHVVANVLKRFLRELPENLLGRHVASFESVTQMTNNAAKLTAYRDLIDRLPIIEQRTLRTIIAHLYLINRLTSANKMTTENLAIAWGPSLLDNNEYLPSDEQEMTFSQAKGDIMVFLIEHYRRLYELTAEQIERENNIVDALLRIPRNFPSGATCSADVKQSGDLKVYVQIDGNANEPVQISLVPTKTAYDVCRELAHLFPGVRPSGLTLFEHIHDGDLKRPLHHTEHPFNVVLRWSYWPEADRKNNALHVEPLRFLAEIARTLSSVAVVSPPQHMRYADTRTRALQKYVLELSECKLLVNRSEKSNSVVRELELRSVTAYLGAEKKRNVTDRWTMTLVENDTGSGSHKKKRDSTYFGHVIAGSNKRDMYEWFASIWYSLNGDSVLPDEEIVHL